MKRGLRLLATAAILLAGIATGGGLVRAASPAEVEVVPIHGTVDAGMAHMVQRAVADAEARHEPIVLDVNTPGGLVSAAFDIRDALVGARVPTIAYVAQRAYSAGALITLSARKIAMAPGASIGAAEPIPKTVKTVAALSSEFAATAATNHRNPTLAAAMVDVNVNAPGYKKAGAILALPAQDALRAKFADAIAPTRGDALRAFGITGAGERTADYTLGERLARFATSPEVSGLLLSIGFLGLLIELQTLHGIAGLVGIGALALFFGSHVYAGFSDPLVIGLAILGVFGIVFELHVLPGHGLAGTLGVIALLAAIMLSFGFAFVFVAVQALSIAIVLSALTFWLSWRIFPENAFVRRLALTNAQGPEFVASADHRSLLGAEGIARSTLRPAGVAEFGRERVDVLTEGDFVPAGTPVRVTRVEGARIFVQPLAKEL